MSARPRRALAFLSALSAVTCLLIGMIGQLGARYEQFDLVNTFAPYWGGVGLVSAVIWIGCRRRSWAAWGTALLMLAIVAEMVGPELAARASQTRSEPATLKLVQYNVFEENTSPAAAEAWIIGTGADVVVLEEVGGSARALLPALTAAYPYQVSCSPGMRCSTMILSRLRPSDSGSLAHADPENRKAPSAAWMRFGDGAKAFTVVGVHYQRPWPYGDQGMTRRAVIEVLAHEGRARTIVAGDFNMTPWTFAMKRQDAAFAMTRVTLARFSWPAFPLPLLPIDQVYIGREWRLSSLALGPANGSDHHPVIVTLRDAASD